MSEPESSAPEPSHDLESPNCAPPASSVDSPSEGFSIEPLPDFDLGAIADPRWFFASLADSLPVNIVCKDAAGKFIYVNQSFAELIGTPASAIIGKTDFEISPPERAKKYVTDDRYVMETGCVYREIEKIVLADKDARYFEVHKSPLCSPDGRIVGVRAVFWDVTAQREAELAAEHENSLLDSLMDNIPDSIYFKDMASRYMRVSDGMAIKFGIPNRKDLIGKSDGDVFSSDHANEAREDELEIMRTRKPVLNKVEKETWPDRPVSWCSSAKMPLEDSTGQVVGTFGISRDITELVETQQALRESKISADTANRAKSDFLANMSHEIRTPMNAVLGITELVLDTDLTPIQRDYLDMVFASGESLLALINDILDFSKIESGKFDLLPGRFGLRDALGDTARVLGTRAHGKNLELAFSVDSDVPDFFIGDIGRLRQVLINLVGNAIKFTKEGEVVIRVKCLQQRDNDVELLIEVSDTGIGIPEDKIEQVFREFEQADVSTTRDYGGTGLGLAISSRLVELMGGKIWAESEIDVGSTFSFTTLLKIATEDTPSPAPLAPSIVVEGLPVLIVDDNETNRVILNDMLLNWGMQPIVAQNANEALAILKRSHSANEEDSISLILTDINMPELDGFDLTEAIRSDPEISKTTVVMLTSGLRDGDAEKCKQLEVEFQLFKPLKQSEVFNAIVSALGLKLASTPQSEATDNAPEDHSKKHNVLLVEDNIVNQKLAVGVLGQQGHSVTIANNGREAIELWQAGEFDLILMDVQMPVMDGFAATQEIRRLEQSTGKRIPIIAMTARAMKEDRDACLAAGMDKYLSKPMRIKALVDCIASIGPD